MRQSADPSAPGLSSATDGTPVPLVGVSVSISVSGCAVLSTVTQRFRNAGAFPLDSAYSFPLEDVRTLCGLEIEMGGRLVEAAVEDRKRAFEHYDEALGSGHPAFLPGRLGLDVFVISAGVLQPGEEALVRLSTVSRAEFLDRGLRIRIPATTSPRRAPCGTISETGPAAAGKLPAPSVIDRIPEGFGFSLGISEGCPIGSVASPSHQVEVQISGSRAEVHLVGAYSGLDSDFLLDVELAKPPTSSAVACRDGEGYALMFRMQPDLAAEERQPKDVIFLVDRSGSMDGESISEARAALLLCLKSLCEGDRFEVIGFGSKCEGLFGTPREYSQESLEHAVETISGWGADLGGTEILEPLGRALGEAGGERFTNILLLTDGQVSNEAEVIALAGRHRKSVRVFSFGIGHGASASLIRGIAKVTAGIAEFIYPGERIEPKVLRQMARLNSRIVWGARLDWGSLAPEAIAPSEIPAFSSGDELWFTCRVPGLEHTSVRLLARNGDVFSQCPVAFSSEDIEGDSAIALLLARGLIDDIESTEAVAGSEHLSRRQKTAARRIHEIALRYGIASSQTSFVAVSTRGDGSSSVPAALRRVPMALVSSREGSSRPGVMKSPVLTALSRTAADLARSKALSGRLVLPVSAPPVPVLVAPEAAGVPEPIPDPFLALVSLQRADGSWMLGDPLCGLAGIPLAKLEDEFRRNPGGVSTAGTLVALFLLRTEHASREDEWRLLAGKSLALLESFGIRPSAPLAGEALVDWMRRQDAGGRPGQA